MSAEAAASPGGPFDLALCDCIHGSFLPSSGRRHSYPSNGSLKTGVGTSVLYLGVQRQGYRGRDVRARRGLRRRQGRIGGLGSTGAHCAFQIAQATHAGGGLFLCVLRLESLTTMPQRGCLTLRCFLYEASSALAFTGEWGTRCREKSTSLNCIRSFRFKLAQASNEPISLVKFFFRGQTSNRKGCV